MGKSPTTIITYVILLCAAISSAQDIYVYPNKRLADQGLIEYRRYTFDEARAHMQGGSFEPYLTTEWSTEQQLTGQQDVYAPKVVTSGDSIFVAYGLIWGRQTFFIKSLNQGVDWQTYVTLVDTTANYTYLYPEILKNNANLFIGFTIQETPYGENVCYYRSSDNGTTWGALGKIFANLNNDISNYSSFCNIGQAVYCATIDYYHDSLYVIRSSDWGNHWNGRGSNVVFIDGMIQPMVLRASTDALHLVWTNAHLPVSVRYSRCTNNGQAWTPEIDIAQDSLGAQRCYVSVQGQHVVISWMGYKYSPYMFTGDMFIKQSNDGGITWDTAQVLTDSHKVWMGSCFVKDSLILVTWQDDRYRSQNYNSEIYTKYSTNYGANWSLEERLSFGDDDSDSPIATTTGGRIHVLWGDRRPGATGLYYSCNDLGVGIEETQIPVNHSILSAYPNPFNSSVVFVYPSTEAGGIRIFNPAGQLVRTLTTDGKEVKVIWDGTDDSGEPLSSGIYFAMISTSAGLKQTKITFLK